MKGIPLSQNNGIMTFAAHLVHPFFEGLECCLFVAISEPRFRMSARRDFSHVLNSDLGLVKINGCRLTWTRDSRGWAGRSWSDLAGFRYSPDCIVLVDVSCSTCPGGRAEVTCRGDVGVSLLVHCPPGLPCLGQASLLGGWHHTHRLWLAPFRLGGAAVFLSVCTCTA